jgi:hypothetical protein
MYGYEIVLKDGISAVANSIVHNLRAMSNGIVSSNRSINASLDGVANHFRSVLGQIGLNPSEMMRGFEEIRQKASESFADIEKKQAILTNSFQSRSASSVILKDLEQFAVANGVMIREAEDSYMNLANRGFAPTMKQMLSLTDIATVSKKGINQLAEAILDAEMQEFERLKEFGIKLEKGKNGITATFRDMVTQIGDSSQDIRKYILGIGEMSGVAGTTQAVAKTAAGGAIAIKNQYEILYRTIGEISVPLESVFGQIAIPILRDLTGSIRQNKFELLQLGSVFLYVGVRIAAVWGVFRLLHGGIVIFGALRVGVIAFYTRLQTAWTWLLANNMALQSTLANGLRAFFTMAASVGGFVMSLVSAAAAQLGLNITMSANPIGLFIVGVAALGFAFYKLYGFVDAMFPNLFKTITGWFKKAFDFVHEWFIKPIMDFFSWLFESAMPKVPEMAGGVDSFAEWKYRTGDDDASVYDFLNPKAGVAGAKKADDKKKKKSGISDKIENSGHGGVKNIHITIGKLIERMEFHTTNMGENASVIRREVERVLLDAVNQVNFAQ